MRCVSRQFVVCAIACALALGVVCPTIATAQEPDAVERLEGSVPLPDDEELEALPPSERKLRASQELDTMRTVLSRVRQLLEDTRENDRDVLKLNCINEKLSAIKGFLKVAEKAQLSLEKSADEGKKKGQVHKLKLILLASMRVQALGEEAETCTGEAAQYSGAPDLDVDVDEDVRTDNPSEVDTEDVPTGPLPDASPFQ